MISYQTPSGSSNPSFAIAGLICFFVGFILLLLWGRLQKRWAAERRILEQRLAEEREQTLRRDWCEYIYKLHGIPLENLSWRKAEEK